MKWRDKETFEVMFVTDETFDAPHPNPDHMTGLLFDPISRTVTLDNPCDEDERVAKIGDVIIRRGTFDSIWPRELFEGRYEQVGPQERYCLECSEAAEHHSGCDEARSASVFHATRKA